MVGGDLPFKVSHAAFQGHFSTHKLWLKSHNSGLGSVPGKSRDTKTNPSAALWAVHSLAILRTSISGLARYVVLKARVCCDTKVSALPSLYHHSVQSSCVKAPPTDQSIILKNKVISRVRLCHICYRGSSIQTFSQVHLTPLRVPKSH